MRRSGFLASTPFRLTLLSAAVIIAAFALTGVAAWFASKDAAEEAARGRIEIEMDSLLQEIAEEGEAAAASAIDGRQHLPASLEYRLTDASGAVLVGNLGGDAPLGWSADYPPGVDGAPSPDLIIYSQPTSSGGRLVIAEDLERTESVRYAVLRALFWTGLGALLVAVAIGYVASRTALKRMDGLFETMERVGAGDLRARVPNAQQGSSDIDLLSRRVNAMLDRVGALVGNLRRVSTDIAHDLRTPIGHIRQQLEEISNAPSLEAAQAAAHAAQLRAEDMTRAFDAMLRLAEIEAGGSRARFTTVPLGSLVEKLADAYKPDIEASGRAFSVQIAADAQVVGDADLLSQAIANLLDNALKYAPANGRVGLRLAGDESETRIEVCDDGPGIAEIDRARVTAPFVRLDAARSAPGVGLGLSIVSAIAALHEATLVLADAEPGLSAAIVWNTGVVANAAPVANKVVTPLA